MAHSLASAHRALSGFLASLLLATSAILAADRPPVGAQDVLTNDSVVQMARAGLSEAVIVAKIRSTRTTFDLRTDALIALRQAGVSNGVIEAMVTLTGSSRPW